MATADPTTVLSGDALVFYSGLRIGVHLERSIGPLIGRLQQLTTLPKAARRPAAAAVLPQAEAELALLKAAVEEWPIPWQMTPEAAGTIDTLETLIRGLSR
jgi:hypothetical protein